MFIARTAPERAFQVERTKDDVARHLERIEADLGDMAADVARCREAGEWGRAIHTITWGVANLNLDRLASAGAEATACEAIRLTLDGPPGRFALTLDLSDFREEDRHELTMDVVENVIRAYAFPLPANHGKKHPAYFLHTKGDRVTARLEFDVEAGERSPNEYLAEITTILDSGNFGGRYTIEPLGRKDAAA